MIEQVNIEILVFRAGKYVLGIDGEEAIEVVNSPEISLPEEKYVSIEGETVFRGESTPVISIYKKWGMPFTGRSNSAIFVDAGDVTYGILIDFVEDVFETRLSELSKFPDFIRLSSGINFIWSIARRGEELIPVMDLDNFLDKNEEDAIIKYRRRVNERDK